MQVSKTAEICLKGRKRPGLAIMKGLRLVLLLLLGCIAALGWCSPRAYLSVNALQRSKDTIKAKLNKGEHEANKEAAKEPELKESEHEAEAAKEAESAKEADAVKDVQAPVDTTSNENVKVQTLQTEKDKEIQAELAKWEQDQTEKKAASDEDIKKMEIEAAIDYDRVRSMLEEAREEKEHIKAMEEEAKKEKQRAAEEAAKKKKEEDEAIRKAIRKKEGEEKSKMAFENYEKAFYTKEGPEHEKAITQEVNEKISQWENDQKGRALSDAEIELLKENDERIKEMENWMPKTFVIKAAKIKNKLNDVKEKKQHEDMLKELGMAKDDAEKAASDETEQK